MSHTQGNQRNQRPLPVPKSKRLRTKRELNAAKFGPKAPLGGSRRAPTAPPRWLQPPPWGGLALGSPLGPPKPVVITQKRLCHRGLFNHEVKSLDVRRLLTPGPCGDGPAAAPSPSEEGAAGGVPAEALKELAAGLASLLGSFGVFLGRELVSERRRSLMAALRRHRRGPPDLGVFLAHRTPGQGTPRAPWQEARPRPPGRVVILGGWEVGDPPARTPSPLRAVHALPPPPRTPSPIFGAPRERENPFSWSPAEDEEDETPGGLPQTWGGPGGLLPPTPPFWRSPEPLQEEEEEEEERGGDEGWAPFSPDPPPWGSPQPRAPPRAPKIWRTAAPWDPPDPSRSPRHAPRPPWHCPDPPRTPPRPLWEPPDPARAASTPPRLCRAPPIWSLEPRKAPPDPPRPLWDPPDPSRPPWDPRPWSPELPRATLDHPRPPRTPQLWNPEPPRAPPDAPRPLWGPPRPHWNPPGVPRPLWDSPDPPRSPRVPKLWSPEPPWDPPPAPRPSRDPRPWSPEPPAVPQNTEPSRCCCYHRLCRDTAQRDAVCRHAARRDSPCRDTRHRAAPVYGAPPKRRCRCPCGGLCWGGEFGVRRGL